MSKKILLNLILFLLLWLAQIQPVTAKQVPLDKPTGTITCFSGGQEILNKKIIAGPFADEYKYAHEVTVQDETGNHNLNFAGGLCIIDRGTFSTKNQLILSDRLSCYSGADRVVIFKVYGRESTVDEYVEGRTFLAKAQGKAFNSDTLHEYLVFGGGACIGEETS